MNVCYQLAQTKEKVRLNSHDNRANLGASTSRNLGISKSTQPFVAFLDAVYLVDRFSVAAKIFSNCEEADGVYETIGVRYHDKPLKVKHAQRVGRDRTGLDILFSPGALFGILSMGEHGHIHLNGLVCRRQVFESFSFKPEMELSQDVLLIQDISAQKSLFPGDLSRGVALRCVRGSNRVFDADRSILYCREYLLTVINDGFYHTDSFRTRITLVIRATRLALPVLKKHRGPIVNVILVPFVQYIGYFNRGN